MTEDYLDDVSDSLLMLSEKVGSVLKTDLMCLCCNEVRFHGTFLIDLTYLRIKFGRPMIIDSCCKCNAYSYTQNDHPFNLHLMDNPYHPTKGCMAVHINKENYSDQERNDLIELARSLGWSIGHASTFLHLDRRVDIGLERREFDC